MHCSASPGSDITLADLFLLSTCLLNFLSFSPTPTILTGCVKIIVVMISGEEPYGGMAPRVMVQSDHSEHSILSNVELEVEVPR